MAFGVFPLSRILLAGVALALVGCSSSAPPSATLIDPSAPTAPTTLVFASITPPPETTTTAVPTTTLPPTTLPAAINGLVPTTDEEREVLVAADELFSLLTQTAYEPFVDDSQLLPIYVDPQLSSRRRFLAGRRERDEISRPGPTQILRFRAIRQSNADRWAVVLCHEDDGTVVQTQGTPDLSDDKIINSGLGGSVVEFELQRTADGWRIADGHLVEKFRGSKCGA